MLPEESAITADTSPTSSITGKLLVALLFVAAIGAFFFFDLKTYLSLDTLKANRARYLFRQWVERKFGDRLGPIQEGFAKNAFSYLLMLRLIPFFPFFLVNLLSGLTRVKVSTYVLATAVGVIPGSVVYAFAGRQLGTIDALSELVSPRLLLAFSLLGLLMLIPVVYRKFTDTPTSRS
jgi:membrane protein DedA with SNARE-associated domain